MTFTAQTLRFLKGLTKHNERPWFEAHRAEYDAYVKAPMRALIEEMDVRLARGNSFLGGGLWMPPRHSLGLIRDAMAERPKAFAAIARDPKLVKCFGGLNDEDRLTRMPRGFAEDHPAGDWLKLKSFTVGRELTDADAISPKLPSLLAKDYALMVPLIRWLNSTIGLQPASRR